MHRRHLAIAEPCDNDWSQMQGTSSVRHCGSCAKNVYNLSMLTEREAKAALAVRPANVCIRYHVDATGHVVFYPEPPPSRMHGAQTLAAAMAVSAMSACARPEPSASASNAAPVVTAPVAARPAAIEAPEPVAKTPLQIAVAPARIAARSETDAGVDKTPGCDPKWDKAFKHKDKRKADHLEPYPDLLVQGGYPPKRPDPPDYVDQLAALPQTPGRDEILAAFNDVKPLVAACGGEGVAYASIMIAGDTGRVTSATITGVEGAVAKCVSGAVRRIRLPKFQRAQFAVKYPFKLTR